MTRARTRFVSASLAALTALLVHIGQGRPTIGEDVVLKSGFTLRGSLDKDNALRMVTDDIKRVFLRDTKIQSITPSSPYANLERFRIEQPLSLHSGGMPVYAIDIKAGPWSDKGRRTFSFVGPGGKPKPMNQAINILGPHLVNYRGIDGFWTGPLSLKAVPKPMVLGILAKVDRKILNERQRIARFLLQAGWLDEAQKEVLSIMKDFPEEKENLKGTLQAIQELDARQKLEQINLAKRARQPKLARTLMKSFPTDAVPSDVQKDFDEIKKAFAEQDAADLKLADSIKETAKSLSAENEKAWKGVLAEILKNLAEAPDAVRDRLVPFSKPDAPKSADARIALAVSGWIVGAEGATSDPKLASVHLRARVLVKDYLTAKDEPRRKEDLDALTLLDVPPDPSKPEVSTKLDLLTVSRLVTLAAPPHAAESTQPGKPSTHRVLDDINPEPTEYMVTVPPEYHPLRNYPTILALHDGNGPRNAIDAWSAEAAKHGFIVVAPEYSLPNQPKNYRYSISEHAAIELALRDARKRYAIDSDRVFLVGNMLGGNVAIDFGPSHPDLFAGIASISGLPAKYAYAYRKNTGTVPQYFALGDLAPGAKEVMFEMFIKPMLFDSNDVLYSEYIRRGHEDLPEEIEFIVDWMERYKREPAPKSFEVFTARPSDARFWGVVVQEINPARQIAPEAADAMGANVKPAKLGMRVSAQTNLINITATGIDRMDIWVSPKTIDFKKKIEVRINGRTYYKALAKPDFAPLLTDLRFRGDRQQLYWLKVSAGGR